MTQKDGSIDMHAQDHHVDDLHRSSLEALRRQRKATANFIAELKAVREQVSREARR